MVLQVRITDPDGSNPLILHNAYDKSLSETINSSDEGINFTIPKNDIKAEILNPSVSGYKKFWEVWDTSTNEKLNYGPLTSVSEQDTTYKIEGKGRSGLLADIISSRKVFFHSIGDLVNDLRYEKITDQPNVSTLIHNTHDDSDQDFIFGTVDVDEMYHGLSKTTKDNIIDGVTNLPFNAVDRPNTYYRIDSYWSGMSKNDAIVLDLGDEYDIDKIKFWFPWWGGKARKNDRGYDWSWAYAQTTGTSMITFDGRQFGEFTEYYNTGSNSQLTRVMQSFDFEPSINMRYIRVNISDVHAWYGSAFDDAPAQDGWDFQCNPDYVIGSFSSVRSTRKGVMDEPISDRVLKDENDCHASVAEIEVYKKFLPEGDVQPLALQRIDNNNAQISYFHTPDPSETTTTANGYRRFEPGGFFRRIKVDYSGANTSYTKFYPKDCTDCYPDGFNFGVVDEYNTMIYGTDNSSGSDVMIKGRTDIRLVKMKGASNAVVTWCDAWRSSYDPLSWGASYSWTNIEGDYAIIHFMGQSFRWFATIPSTKVGATVRIEIRSKIASTYSNWATLEDNYVLPNDVSSEPVYEISYESGYLQPGTIYEIRITNLDGGFLSIDSIEGYWAASMVEYNEDSRRLFVSQPQYMRQVYDKRFTNGSMYMWNKPAFISMSFNGDRAIIKSFKGRHHGKMRVLLVQNTGKYDPGLEGRVFIPGGEADGSLLVNLNTGKRGVEVPGAIIFDSNEYFTNGLPWGSYSLSVWLNHGDLETYNAYPSDPPESFKPRCHNCKPNVGTPTEANRWVFLDSITVHETVGLSVDFQNETHLDQLKSLAEAVQVEWNVSNNGIEFKPRIGTDTNIVLREGQNTVVKIDIANDFVPMASILLSEGSDVDGIPLTALVEDRAIRRNLGRTVMRKKDFRDVGDYQQLIGISRTELKRRAEPEKRITVTHVANNLTLNKGDSFILYTKKMGAVRVRINRREIQENNDGRTYELECITWPQIR